MVGITAGGVELLAQRYARAGSYLYTVGVPLSRIADVLPIPDPDVPVEGNRRVSIQHAREFADYWQTNERWAVPPLLADTARSLAAHFTPIAESDDLVAGVLRLPSPGESGLHILDGQHRVLGWSLLRREPGDHHGRLDSEAVTLEILERIDVDDHKQFFYDIAANAKGITKSLSAGFDKRLPLNRAAHRLVEEHPLLAGRVDMENDRVANRRSQLLSLQNVVDIVTAANTGINGWIAESRRATLNDESALRVATRALDALCWAFDELADVCEDALTPMELREKTLLGSVSMLRVLAGTYHNLAVRNGNVVEVGDAHARAVFAVLNEHMALPIDDFWWESEVFGHRDARGPRARRQDLQSLVQYVGYLAARVRSAPASRPLLTQPKHGTSAESPREVLQQATAEDSVGVAANVAGAPAEVEVPADVIEAPPEVEVPAQLEVVDELEGVDELERVDELEVVDEFEVVDQLEVADELEAAEIGPGTLNKEATPRSLRGPDVPDDLLQLFARDFARYPLLSATDEVRLAKAIEVGVFAEERLADVRVRERRERRELEWLARSGRRAFDEFVCSNLRLVVSIARGHSRRGLAIADLIQEGTLGLIRAVQKYDWTTGYKFSTYATWWIRQSITRALADNSRTIRLPVHVAERLNKIRGAHRGLSDQNGRLPTVTELAEATGFDTDEVDEVLGYDRVLWSLEQPLSANNDELVDAEWDGERWVVPLGMLIVDEGASADEDDLIEIIRLETFRKQLHQVFETLSEREAGVMLMRHGFFDGDERTLEEIGHVYGVTRERIRQIEKATLEKLRHPSRSDFLRPYLN